METKPVVKGLFANTPQGPRLLGSKCVACGTPYFPKSPVCHNPSCDQPRIEEAQFGPYGTLWSYVVQHYPPPPPVRYDEPYVPYAVGAVDLPEGLRVLGRVSIDDVQKIKIGMKVELVIERLCGDKDGNEVTTWKFRSV
jgi:uncharacterized OB-fold protein